MREKAALGISLIQGEGGAIETLAAAGIVAVHIWMGWIFSRATGV